MSQISIYLLAQPEDNGLLTLCRLADKNCAAQRRMFAFTTDGDQAYDLDALLWVFRPGAFVSHERLKDEPVQTPMPALLIGAQEPPDTHRQLLFNLSMDIPDWHRKCDRVIEVVRRGKEVREACRQRLKRYMAMGYEVKTFEQNPDGTWQQRM